MLEGTFSDVAVHFIPGSYSAIITMAVSLCDFGLLVVVIVCLFTPAATFSVSLTEKHVEYIPYAENSQGNQAFALEANLAEQVAYHPRTRTLYVVGKYSY